jgi:hypothetical protein
MFTATNHQPSEKLIGDIFKNVKILIKKILTFLGKTFFRKCEDNAS